MLSKRQILAVAVALVVLVLLALSPRTVLKKAENAAEANRDKATETDDVRLGPVEWNAVDAQVAKKLEQELNTGSDADKPETLAKLVNLAQHAGRPDHAAKWQLQLLQYRPTAEQAQLLAQLMQAAWAIPASNAQPEALTQLNNKALQAIEKLLAKMPQDKALRLASGLLYVHSPTPMMGIQRLKGLADENPKNYDAQLALGIFSIESNQLDKALERLKAANAARPDEAAPLLWLSRAYELKGDSVQAQNYAQQARTKAGGALPVQK